MTQQVTYTYLGTNGTLITPIHLEGVYSVKKIVLTADAGKRLTQDRVHLFERVTVKSEEEIPLWKEVPAPVGQN